jgi:hypothetical protein
MDDQFTKMLASELVWLPKHGMGYVNVKNPKNDYFSEYTEKSNSIIGRALTDARVNLVNKYTNKTVVDIGIGSGSFIAGRSYITMGYDIDKQAIKWLEANKLFYDPYEEEELSNVTTYRESRSLTQHGEEGQLCIY